MAQRPKTLVELTQYGRARHEQYRSAGVHRQSASVDGQHVMEIWRRGRRQHLVGQHRGLVRDAVFHRQLVQRPQYRQRRCICAATALEDDTGEAVLNPLQLNDGRCWYSVQQGVAVVKPVSQHRDATILHATVCVTSSVSRMRT